MKGMQSRLHAVCSEAKAKAKPHTRREDEINQRARTAEKRERQTETSENAMASVAPTLGHTPAATPTQLAVALLLCAEEQ
jgi:hypothetical protein